MNASKGACMKMGNATSDKEEQVTYLKRRTKLLAEVVGSMEASSAGADDLSNVLSMLDALTIKVKRFKKDWEKNNPTNISR